MANPPAAVKLALESVCLMLNCETTDWKQIRSIMVKDSFISTIVNFDTMSITYGIPIFYLRSLLSRIYLVLLIYLFILTTCEHFAFLSNHYSNHCSPSKYYQFVTILLYSYFLYFLFWYVF